MEAGIEEVWEQFKAGMRDTAKRQELTEFINVTRLFSTVEVRG